MIFFSEVEIRINKYFSLLFIFCYELSVYIITHYVWIIISYILLLMAFNFFISVFGTDITFDYMNGPQNSNDLNSSGGNPNFGSSNSGSHNTGGPQGPHNNQLFHNPQRQDEDDTGYTSNPFIQEVLSRKLSDHKVSCAENNPYSTRLCDTNLPNKFTPAEHEYICDRLMNYSKTQGTNFGNKYIHDIVGKMPDRRYEGSVGFKLIDIIRRT
jgi:hypothetical protein